MLHYYILYIYFFYLASLFPLPVNTSFNVTTNIINYILGWSQRRFHLPLWKDWTKVFHFFCFLFFSKKNYVLFQVLFDNTHLYQSLDLIILISSSSYNSIVLFVFKKNFNFWDFKKIDHWHQNIFSRAASSSSFFIFPIRFHNSSIIGPMKENEKKS